MNNNCFLFSDGKTGTSLRFMVEITMRIIINTETYKAREMFNVVPLYIDWTEANIIFQY